MSRRPKRRRVQNTQNAPSVSMGPYLIESGQTRLLTKISIYSERGESREQVRLLYMNAVALQVWIAMGKKPSVIGAQYRPSRTSLLAFGVRSVNKSCSITSTFIIVY